jgi:hypothetical protein
MAGLKPGPPLTADPLRADPRDCQSALRLPISRFPPGILIFSPSPESAGFRRSHAEKSIVEGFFGAKSGKQKAFRPRRC